MLELAQPRTQVTFCITPILLIALFSLILLGAPLAQADEPLPVPWNGIDIGSLTPAGVATEKNRGFTITAGGSGFSGVSDRFHFVYQSVTGDFSLTARVLSSANAGVMVREALAATSSFAAALQTPSQSAVFAYRTLEFPQIGTDALAEPHYFWLRLVKRGIIVNGYAAPEVNGVQGVWKQIGGGSPIASGMVYAGLCLSGPAPGTPGEAVFDHIALTLGPPALDDGVYTIVPVSAPALALDATDTQVTLGSPGKKWALTRQGKNVYSIQPMTDMSLALTVLGSGSKSGTQVVLQADSGQPAQRWSVVPNSSNGTYGLVPQCAPGSGLDDFAGSATAGARIDIWDRWDSDPHTQWTFTTAP